MEIKSLGEIDFDTIFDAFSRAFADYELQLDKNQLRAMLQRRGFNPDLSFAAFDKNQIAAFTFNGIGNFNGIATAYDTGTGTLKEYRGKGLATKIFEHSIPYLRKEGIKQYLLEVLQYNTKAISVYRKLGFNTIREFNYFRQKNEKINFDLPTHNIEYPVRKINMENFKLPDAFGDFHPSWQNSLESIQRDINSFVCLGAFSDDKLIGYCVFEPNSGDITLIAVDKENRRKGIASLLLKEVALLNKNDSIKIINTDISCSSITNFLKAKNIEITGTQFEMIKEL
ncbi:GNAT family N-acetyltransferase [Dysgonomonas macrotermitis]|uniref:Ribosomal protein S18 acetylase RimI n=1 Tax=Dysgonomonas macrotermitis TaxID=1346286 RepID=A0A1M4UQQ6_9BACT|nr:GNAT family N-acetyltransferase [Dysgonomonas macrotermitis]SHE58930.1 Ribosomal protein S18 acetylase RimI [Dysgonomonas macrotermitis]